MEQSTEEAKETTPKKSDTWSSEMKENMYRYLENATFHGAICIGDGRRNIIARYYMLECRYFQWYSHLTPFLLHTWAPNKKSRERSLSFWFLVIFAMVGVLFSTIHELKEMYWSYPFKTEVTSVQHDRLPLPAISFCMRHSIKRSRLLQLQHGEVIERALLSPFDETLWANTTVRHVLSQVTLEDVMEAGSFRRDEIIRDISVGPDIFRQSADNITFATWDGVLDGNGVPVRCFTFNNTDSQGNEYVSLDHLSELVVILHVPTMGLLRFDDRGGIFVSIGAPGELPSSLDTVNMMPGSAVDIKLSMQRNSFLPFPYLSMRKDCEDTKASDYKSPLKLMKNYTYINCFHEKIILSGLTDCGCMLVPLAADGEISRYPLCTLLQYYTCIMKVIIRKAFDSSPPCKHTCFQETRTTKSTTASPYPACKHNQGFPNATCSRTDILKVTVKYDTTLVQDTKHTPAMTIHDVYGLLGGRMGLFIGASLLTVMELIEFVMWTLWCSLKHLKRKMCDRGANSHWRSSK